jgi:anti-anti-sigma regulatory factor
MIKSINIKLEGRLSHRKHEDLFDYLISQKGPLLVITFVGEFEAKCDEKIDSCLEELENYSDCSAAVLYFRDVEDIQPSGYKAFIKLARAIRFKYKRFFKICSLKPNLRRELDKAGLINKGEVTNNMRETMLMLIGDNKKEAA